MVACELRGREVDGVETVRRGTAAVRAAEPAFVPQYDRALLER